MNSNPVTEHTYLRRLDPSYYRGTAFVHWTFTIDDRQRGWLNTTFHSAFRERLIHACFRYHLWVPTYTLMPDHLHLLVLGSHPDSDQRLAMRWLRKHINWLLAPRSMHLQTQGYDHVLRDRDRDRFAFERTAHYVLENPVRAGLVERACDWPCYGAVLPGFPEVENVKSGEFWDNFWRVYSKTVTANEA